VLLIGELAQRTATSAPLQPGETGYPPAVEGSRLEAMEGEGARFGTNGR
jgi:hypothetical protein